MTKIIIPRFVPMGIFNVVPMSDIRLWTLLWDIKHRYGHIDKYMPQHIMSGLRDYSHIKGFALAVISTNIHRKSSNSKTCDKSG
jgi:hypothetical protein